MSRLTYLQSRWIQEIIKSNQIKSNQIYLRQKKEHNATQKKQSKYVDRTQRQYETALTSALQNKYTTTGI